MIQKYFIAKNENFPHFSVNIDHSACVIDVVSPLKRNGVFGLSPDFSINFPLTLAYCAKMVYNDHGAVRKFQ